MFKHRFGENTSNSVVLHWFLLCINGGAINAGGFLATGKFVSHVTGFATLFGVGISQSKIDQALGILSVPLFFLLGAFVAGLLIDRPLFEGRKPHFDWVMGISAPGLYPLGVARWAAHEVAADVGSVHKGYFGLLFGGHTVSSSVVELSYSSADS
jgi:hypothetical protein